MPRPTPLLPTSLRILFYQWTQACGRLATRPLMMMITMTGADDADIADAVVRRTR